MIRLIPTSHNSLVALTVCLITATFGCQEATQITPDAVPARVQHVPGVVLLRYAKNSGSTEQRELGFLQTLDQEYPELPVLTSSIYAGTTPESTKRVTLELLDFYGDAVQGIFSVCEANTDGALRALEESGLAGEVRFVGMDPSPASLAGLQEGKLDGLVTQDPVQMGFVAVDTMIEHLNGTETEQSISTGEYMVTKENMQSATLQPMIRPKRFSRSTQEVAEPSRVIGVVPKGSTHSFWDSVRAGAQDAADQSGDTTIRFEAPILEGDLERQIEIIDHMIADGVNGLCIVPIDADALIPIVQKAKQAGIPTVVFDSNLYGDESLQVAYVATDNYEAGALAARRMAEVLGYTAKPAAVSAADSEGSTITSVDSD